MASFPSLNVPCLVRAGRFSNVYVFSYKNHRGETRDRKVIPEAVWYGSTEWHPEPQWLLRAWDVEKNDWRDFALKNLLPPKE